MLLRKKCQAFYIFFLVEKLPFGYNSKV